jgi:prepilin signal peptidase PulO-like enzyme (type II secretory pathway)
MDIWSTILVTVGALLVAMVALVELGRRLGQRRLARHSESTPGASAVDGAVFALLGLLIGFTFSGALSRFDERRHLATAEANNIGTAWLRIDTLPAEGQPALRDLFRRYLDARLETYRSLPDLQASRAALNRSIALQGAIWNLAVSLSFKSGTPAAAMLLLPSLNELIDITTTRTMATEMHPPYIVFVMLVALALASSLLAGYGMAGGRRNWAHVIAFAVVIASTIYVILDLEYPRLGFIRVDAVDHVLQELRQSMQ